MVMKIKTSGKVVEAIKILKTTKYDPSSPQNGWIVGKMKYKNKIFDIDTGELLNNTVPRKHRRGRGTVPRPVIKKVKHPPISSLPKERQQYIERMMAPRFGMGVTCGWLKTRCLKEEDQCKRFHSVSYSDGEIQGVICVWGPKKICERRKGGREK